MSQNNGQNGSKSMSSNEHSEFAMLKQFHPAGIAVFEQDSDSSGHVYSSGFMDVSGPLPHFLCGLFYTASQALDNATDRIRKAQKTGGEFVLVAHQDDTDKKDLPRANYKFNQASNQFEKQSGDTLFAERVDALDRAKGKSQHEQVNAPAPAMI